MECCQIHKLRNILDHLPDRQRPWVKAIVQRAYRSAEVETAAKLLQNLAQRLDTNHPSAAESVREGLDETLTIVALGLWDESIARESQRLEKRAESPPGGDPALFGRRPGKDYTLRGNPNRLCRSGVSCSNDSERHAAHVARSEGP